MPKLLGEFLQEQQEPFALDVYLLERGFCSQRKRRQAIPNCAEIVRAVLGRLVVLKNGKIKKKDWKTREDRVDEEEFSSATATTLYNSCAESDVEDAAACNELSPISVLEEAGSEVSPLHKKQYHFEKAQGESSQSISKCQSKQPTYKFEQGGFCHDQYIINKRALHQTKQLLVDSVKEVIEIKRKRENADAKGQQLKKILGAEELWKLVCENVWVWSQESVHGTNVFRLLNHDFMASLQDWDSASAQHKNEISMEIGDAILEDIVNDIVKCY